MICLVNYKHFWVWYLIFLDQAASETASPEILSADSVEETLNRSPSVTDTTSHLASEPASYEVDGALIQQAAGNSVILVTQYSR
jgi:hypothetical protein